MNSIWKTAPVVAQSDRIVRSFEHWTGRELVTSGDSVQIAEVLYQAPFAVVSHDASVDPILNYGNGTAQLLWEMSWEELTATPSRLTAETANRDERARSLAAVAERGWVENYSGIRISKTGRRFWIKGAIIWNLVDEVGGACGQAAMFREWQFI